MASAMSFTTPTTTPITMFHQPAARRPISFAPQPRFSLNPLSNEELINKRSSLPSASRDLAAALVRQRPGTDTNAYIKTTAGRKQEIEDSNEMARLITLVLQPRLHHKRESAYLSLLETLNDDPISQTIPLTIPPKNKRRSLVGVPGTIVYTNEEWKQGMEEVKSLFGRRHFKKCSSRCKQLLKELHYQHQHQPVYTIYLCFYAAISLEQTARSLHNNSDIKLPLFRESLAYYRKAKATIPSASFSSPTPKRMHHSRHSSTRSISSSNRSSIESLFSQFSFSGSEATSAPDSPHKRTNQHHRRNTSSVSSIMKPAPLRIRKKVSFSESLPTFIDIAQRQTQKSHSAEWDLINCFPLPPSPSNCPSLMDSSGESEDDEVDVKSRETASAIERFQLRLKTFGGQLDWHISSINTAISLLEEVIRRQNEILCSAGELKEMNTGSPKEEEAKRAELKKRIARRKAEKWEWKKFDAKRYQELCDKALAEVDGVIMCA